MAPPRAVSRRTPRFAGNTERCRAVLSGRTGDSVAEPHDSQGILKEMGILKIPADVAVAEPHDSQGILKGDFNCSLSITKVSSQNPTIRREY